MNRVINYSVFESWKGKELMTDKSIHDSKIFEVLVREHHRRLLAYAQSLVKNNSTAEDLVQEALITAYKKIDTFDAKASFPAWVRGIIRYKYLEYSRSHREIALEEQLLDTLDSTHAEWDKSAEKQNLFAALSACLSQLPEALHSVVYMFYMKKLPGHEVALCLKSNEQTVRKRLQRARQQLGRCIRLNLNEGA